jgi:molecular chaperone DnaJ
VKGRGAAGASGGPAGDLFVVVRVQSHPLFGRAGNDVTIRLPVTFSEATLGADVRVPTLDGQVTMRIPPGTPNGKVMRVRGHGVAGDRGHDAKADTGASHNGTGGGDLLVTIEVVIPTKLDEPRREAVQALAAVFDDNPRAELFDKQQNRRSSDG